MLQLWILLLSVGLAMTSPVDLANKGDLMTKKASSRNIVETTVLDLLEDLRKTMVTGSNDVPVLDPFQLENLHVDDSIIPFPGSSLTVDDLKVEKLSTFVINVLSVNQEGLIILQRYRLLADFHVPSLDVNAGAYDLKVSALGVDLFGKGVAEIKLIAPRVIASLRLVPRVQIIGGIGLFFRIDQCEVKFLLEDIHLQITGLLGDDSIASFVNAFLRNLVVDAVKLYEPEITKFLSDTVLEIGNDILHDLDLTDFIGGN